MHINKWLNWIYVTITPVGKGSLVRESDWLPRVSVSSIGQHSRVFNANMVWVVPDHMIHDIPVQVLPMIRICHLMILPIQLHLSIKNKHGRRSRSSNPGQGARFNPPKRSFLCKISVKSYLVALKTVHRCDLWPKSRHYCHGPIFVVSFISSRLKKTHEIW